MPELRFDEEAWYDYMEAQQDKSKIRRINALIKEILRDPFHGIGKPEPLKHGDNDRWSRRINDSDRLVYRVTKDAIVILQCKGHYDD